MIQRGEPFTYEFRSNGGSSPGKHCTYCPKSQSESCSLTCAAVYRQLEAERTADGVKVTE